MVASSYINNLRVVEVKYNKGGTAMVCRHAGIPLEPTLYAKPGEVARLTAVQFRIKPTASSVHDVVNIDIDISTTGTDVEFSLWKNQICALLFRAGAVAPNEIIDSILVEACRRYAPKDAIRHIAMRELVDETTNPVTLHASELIASDVIKASEELIVNGVDGGKPGLSLRGFILTRLGFYPSGYAPLLKVVVDLADPVKKSE